MRQRPWNSLVIWVLLWDLGVESWHLGFFPLGDLGGGRVVPQDLDMWLISMVSYISSLRIGLDWIPSKWPFMAYNWGVTLTTYPSPGMIFQVAGHPMV